MLYGPAVAGRSLAARQAIGAPIAVRSAIEQALRQDWHRLFGYALRLCGDRETASDLLQTCAMKALGSGSAPDGDRLRPWLYAILRNSFFDERRHAAIARAEPGGDVDWTAPWRHDDRMIAGITVHQALARLDPLHRDIIELVDLAGFRYAEAAEILGVPVGTVMSRLSRARLALLDAISEGRVAPIAARRRRGGL
jgi:RNA polymerase sigma-70 factor (ECF subfamily)